MDLNAYANRAAQKYIHSMKHYNNSSPAVGDGRVGTPAYYANMLNNVAIARGDAPKGSGWWGYVWLDYANSILAK